MNRIRQSPSSRQTPPNVGITELIIANSSPEQTSLLMPMIAFLTKSGRDRWLTWITPSYVSRDFLESYDVDTGVMRIIHRSEEEEGCMWLTLEALAAGNSHTVISSLGKLIDKEFRQLELAAFEGKCQGLLLRTR